MSSSNCQIKIENEGEKNLLLAMEIAFENHKSIGFSISYLKVKDTNELEKVQSLIFYWAAPSYVDNFVKMPHTMDFKQAARFALDWLAEAKYGEAPDHDGDNGKGWLIRRDYWGHVNDRWEAIIAITPNWAMYGK